MQMQGLAVLLLACIVLVDSSCLYHARMKRGAKAQKAPERVKRSSSCDFDARYRTYDGTCNNKINPEWGSVNQPFLRLLDAEYGTDDIPRYQSGSTNLPTPREISEGVHFNLNFTSNKYSVFIMQWGQFLDHDITKTPNVDDNGSEIDCCARSDSVLTNSSSPCYTIDIASGDSYFDNRTCMNFVRSDPVTVNGKREQYNSLTAFIDASMVYGTSDDEVATLRENTTGSTHLLKVNTIGSDDFLPENSDSSVCFDDPNTSVDYCFLAGDARSNVFTGLGAMHTLFVREHNRIAADFKSTTSWTEDKIFEETRRIIAAEIQVITYKHWLPLIVGSEAVTDYSLALNGYSYDNTTNPNLANSFSGAAFRFGHSQVPDKIDYDGADYETSLLFKRTRKVIENFDAVLAGLASTSSQRADAWYVDEMRNRMFETAWDAQDGFDMVALNIQRGRDHGIPPYNDWREYCGLARIQTFVNQTGNLTDFGNVQANDFQDLFTSAQYNLTVDDLDLYSAGISEIPLGDADVGPTFKCLIGKQFQRLRDGDRYWYKTTDPNIAFTDAQITQLEKRTLAQIICDNTGITSIQRNVFKKETGSNVNCSNLKDKLKLNPFRV